MLSSKFKYKLSNTKTVSIPIAYGTIAFWQGKKADDKHTHKWIAFVRGPNNEDLSQIISKVIFILHPSFEK